MIRAPFALGRAARGGGLAGKRGAGDDLEEWCRHDCTFPIADVFVGGVLSTRVALAMGFDSVVVGG